METDLIDSKQLPNDISTADKCVCKLLAIKSVKKQSRTEEDKAQKIFSISIVISGLRCLLSYVIFPFILPIIGFAGSFTPYIGLIIGIVALIFDVIGMRRFFVAQHKMRWMISVIYLGVMTLVVILIALDLTKIISKI
jgi:hypothetical protein